MPSRSLTVWLTDRRNRLNEIETACIGVATGAVPNSIFLEESLRGFVMHLSAHYQGFCRDLYHESTQLCVAAIPIALRSAAQTQFLSQLVLEKSNPSYENIRRDFNRFGFILNVQSMDSAASGFLTDSSHLNDWRNRAAHQAAHPFRGGVPNQLSLTLLQKWRMSCDRLTSLLDKALYDELTRLLGANPW